MAATLVPVRRTAEDVQKLYREAERAAVRAEKAAAAHAEALADLSRDELRKLAALRGVHLSRLNRTKTALLAALTAPNSAQ